MSSKHLFLDFDGVLHPSQGGSVADFARASELARALGTWDCKIVVSSTWREHYPVAKLRQLLAPHLDARLADVLGPDVRGPHWRYLTIQAWLRANGGGKTWVALDDEPSAFPAGCPNLILCDGWVGFDDPQAMKLRAWLQQ